MADHELPGDVRHWPTDPYELLGVPYTVLPRDLKRSYTRLIRAYKPEQAPEQFRLIREAYENVLRWVGHRTAYDVPADEQADEPVEPAIERSTPSAFDGDNAQENPTPIMDEPVAWSRVRTLDEELEEHWTYAVEGAVETAYQGLLELHRRHPTNGDICLRLYWLLALSPELDPVGTPCDWLTTGLRSSRLAGPLRELFRREVVADPSLALNESFMGLVEYARQPSLVFDFVQWRWHAAAWRNGLADVVMADLERLRPQVQHADEETWCRLLMMALDLVAWLRNKTAVEFSGQLLLEIDRHEHLHLRLPNEFMRVDLLRELSRGCRKMSVEERMPPALLGLLAASWWQPFDEIRSSLVANLGHMARHPIEAMQTWDQVRQEASSALAHFSGLLDQLEYRLEAPYESRPSELIARVVLDFAAETYWRAYLGARPTLVEFCIREDIAPRVVSEVCGAHDSQTTGMPPDVPQQIADDWVAEIVYRGCRLFSLC